MNDTADAASNVQPYTVSELAFALKRTLEDAFGFVRLRGELSKVTHHQNGHIYLDLKDDRACISGVVWRTQARLLAVKPQTGLEVIVTGRITTYPGRSQYQIIIETMEPAGIGALLAQLERLKAKLAAEGLFDAARKRPLPAMPRVIGVITSPTGAVIRDILHRIRERWPCHVIVWPSVMQGEAAAASVAAAIAGFNHLAGEGAIRRPDVLIVARGGGSIEDLWPFNDEALARAAAASAIPLISAVGHETDTTLIDFAADRRAPTPTAAAEIATPVLAELAAGLAGLERRLINCAAHALEVRRTRLVAAARALPRRQDLVELPAQRLEGVASRLGAALGRNVSVHARALAGPARLLSRALVERPIQVKGQRLTGLAGRLDAALGRNAAAHARELAGAARRLNPGLVERPVRLGAQRLSEFAARLAPLAQRRLGQERERLASLERQRVALNPEGPLDRGYALVLRPDRRLVRSAFALRAHERVSLKFADGERSAAVDGTPPRPRPGARDDPGQGDLF